MVVFRCFVKNLGPFLFVHEIWGLRRWASEETAQGWGCVLFVIEPTVL